MGIIRNRKHTLSGIFLGKLLFLSAAVICEALVFLLALRICFNAGILLPANYSQYYLKENARKIASGIPFDETLIPITCRYGLYDETGEYIQGNLKEKEKVRAQSVLEGREVQNYMKINRDDGVCIIRFDVVVHFAQENLHRIFPQPETAAIVTVLAVFMLTVLFTAFVFERRLRRELAPLQEEIAQIKIRELTLEHKSSTIVEFQEVLDSLEDMKKALSESLKKEWETEQRRRSNISAIAHDIKTPLTIMKGSAQLMQEETQLKEIYQLAGDIDGSADKMEQYLGLLIQETKGTASAGKKEETDIKKLVEEIRAESKSLCAVSRIVLECEEFAAEGCLFIDRELVIRAVMNLVKNGVEHTRDRLKISFFWQQGRFRIRIEDFGVGFSEEALLYGNNQFYTEHKDRGGQHYGLGLSIADSVAKDCGGWLCYENKKDGTGAIVEFEIAK